MYFLQFSTCRIQTQTTEVPVVPRFKENRKTRDSKDRPQKEGANRVPGHIDDLETINVDTRSICRFLLRFFLDGK